MKAFRIAVALMALVVVAFTLRLAFAPGDRIAGTNLLDVGGYVVQLGPEGRMCQVGEPLPAGAATAELILGAPEDAPAPALRMTIRKDGRTLAEGTRAGGWRGGPVRIPFSTTPLRKGVTGVRVCVESDGPGVVLVAGEGAEPVATVAGRPQGGRVGITYFEPRDSLAGIFGTIMERYGRGNASWLGGWTVLLVAGLGLAAVLLAAAALLAGAREQRDGPRTGRRIPRPVGLSAAAAGAVGLAFALLVPPMQVPDEPANVAYTMFLAEGTMPIESQKTPYPDRLRVLQDGLGTNVIRGRAYVKPPWTAEAEAGLRFAEEREKAPLDTDNASSASGNPPLYYALGVIPYALTPGSVLDKLLPMRLLSVLLGVLTVLAAGLFLRELLPRSPTIAAAGTLVVAFQPKFAFMSGGFNADALLFTASAVTLLAMARLLRHGLTGRRAMLLGLAVATGILSKPLFLALVPPVLLTLAVAAWRAHGTPWRRRLAHVGIALGVGFVPVLAYSYLGGLLADHPYFPRGTSVSALSGNGNVTVRPSWFDQLSYIWQLFLPRFPPLMQTDFFPGSLTLRDIWSAGFIGGFGWTDYGFSAPVQVQAFRLLVAVGILAAICLVVHRGSWRERRVELGIYVITVVCVAGAVGVQDYRAQQIASAFRQARYLLPLLVLYGGLVAVAARLFGRRIGAYAGAVAVAVAAAHVMASLLVTMSRYYA